MTKLPNITKKELIEDNRNLKDDLDSCLYAGTGYLHALLDIAHKNITLEQAKAIAMAAIKKF